MPIKEKSFRIGCGRYVQEPNAVSGVGDEALIFGKKAIVVGGETALSVTKEKLVSSLNEKGVTHKIIVHKGTCNHEDAKEIAEEAKDFDVIIGVGGGVIMDFAKLCAYYSNKPIINVPTSSATCAAYTPLSVCYTRDGKTVGSLHYTREVNAVIVDTEVMVNQPPRLFISGFFDSIAKFIEIKHRFKEEDENAEVLGIDYAYHLSKQTYKFLCGKAEAALEDLKNHRITPDFENMIFTLISVTGVISSIARGSNQTAIAHKFYETVRTLNNISSAKYLHGEIVGMGLLLQNHYNAELSENALVEKLMREYELPASVSQLGIEKSDDAMMMYHNKLMQSSTMLESGEDGGEKLLEAMKYLWVK